MMKRILVFVVLFVLSACNTTSNGSWNTGPYPTQAQSAPSKLTSTGDEEQDASYTPYNPALGESAAIRPYEGYDAAGGNIEVAQNGAANVQDNGALANETNVASGVDYRIPGGVRMPERYTATAALPPVKVALLLPLSGQHEDLGQSMLQAAQLALFDMGYDAFKLMPRDTRGTPQGAAQAAQSVVNEGAQLILGPLFANEAKAVKPIATRARLNMIAFSTDWSLAGGNTFVMGFLPFAQVERVTEYAVKSGLHDIGILAPNTAYSNAVVAAYNSLAYRAGLRTAEVARYMPDSSDTSSIIRNFTKYDERKQALETQKQSYQARLAQNANDGEARSALRDLEQRNTAGPLPFQAVLMPVGGEEARSISNMLSYYDLAPDQVQRIGTGLWDDRSLAGEPALNGAWFAASSPDLRRDFETRYRDLYGSKPLRLATLAYDATALAAVLAKKSYREKGRISYDRYAIVNPNGFSGIDGIFRFRPDGMIERGLAVLEFRNGTIKVIDPAPSTFQRMDY